MVDNKWLKLIADYEAHCQRVVKATIVDTGETVEEKSKRIAKTEKHYITWFEYYFPHYAKKKSAKFHVQLANKVIKKKKIRLLAEMYRSSGKSVHIDMGIPLYLYMVKKELFFMLLVGETDPKAKKLISSIQAELEFNQRIINDYGRKFKQGNWADGDFFTTDGVQFTALSFGTSPRGVRQGAQRPDYIVVDDVDNKKHVNNDRLMTESVDYITEDIEGTFDSDSDSDACERMIYANNNFHRNSITNRLKLEYEKIIKKELETIGSTDYEVFTICAVKDLVSFEPTWPEKTTAEYWRNKYNRKPRSFLREYMHVHALEGKFFKAEMMQWKKMLPLKDYDQLVFVGDLSYKDQGDFKAMFLIGRTGKEYHIIHSFLRQCSRADVAQWLYDLYERRSLCDYNIEYIIDGLFAQDEFISDFDREGDERGYYIPVVANKKPLGNKFDRIESLLGYFLRRWIWWNIDEKEQLDQIECIDQFTAFEKGSQAHDDGPDDIEFGIKRLEAGNFQEKFEPRIVKRKSFTSRY